MEGIRDLEQKILEWSAAGLVTEDQADEILRHESKAAEERSRSSALAEILGYLGGALALVAALVLTAQFWPELQLEWRLAVIGGTTALVAVAAWLLGRNPSALIQRLSDFLFALATVGLAFLIGLVAAEVVGLSTTASFSLGSGGAALTSLVLWRLRASPIRHVALFASLTATAISSISNLDDIESFYLGLAIWALGLAWGALAWSGVLGPTEMGLRLGASAMLLGSMIGSFGDLTAGSAVLGLGTAGALVAGGVLLHSVFVLATGTAAVFIAVPRIVFDSFGDAAGGAVGLLASGLVLVAAAVVVNRLGKQIRNTARESVATRAAHTVGANRGVVVGAAVALLVLVTGFIVFVGYTPPPTFPPVDQATPAPQGVIAFQRWDGNQACLFTIDAAGGDEHEVVCDPEMGPPLNWTADGNIAVMTYTDEARVQVFDPASGSLVDTISGGTAEQQMYENQYERTSFEGLQLEWTTERGSAGIVTRRDTDATQTVLTVEGPNHYGLWDLQWSPDGQWILAVDSKSRMVLVAADGSSGPYELVEDANGPAWHIPGLDTYTVSFDT